MSWNVLSGRDLRQEAREVLADFASVTLVSEYDTETALLDDLHRFDAIINGGLAVPREMIERADSLKIIASEGVGVDNVDVEAATEHGVIVANNLGANTRAVAEYTIAGMFAVRRKLRQADHDLRAGTWEKYGYAGPELEGQLLGVVGYGAIGRLVCELANGIGMRTIAYDPYVDATTLAEYVELVDSVPELFERADVVSLHVPLNTETRGLVGLNELRLLGKEGIVINAARGGIIVESDLAYALDEDLIWGAAVDVFEVEPAPRDHPLFDLDDIIVSPHMAGSTTISIPAKHKGAAENVRSVYEGRVPQTAVNRDQLILHVAQARRQ